MSLKSDRCDDTLSQIRAATSSSIGRRGNPSLFISVYEENNAV